MNTELHQIDWHQKKLKIKTYSRNAGDECIVYIHGLGCSGTNIFSIFENKLFTGYSILSFDFPGHGGSPANPYFSYRLEAYVEVCLDLIKKLKAKKYHLIAHSMGGAIGTLLIDQEPDIFETYICIEGNLLASDSWMSRKTASVPYKEFLSVMKTRVLLARMSSNDSGSREWASCAERTDPDAFYRSAVALMMWSDSGLLMHKFKSLKLKKVYVSGNKSINNGVIKELDIALIPNIIIPESGHFPMIENPDFLYEKIFKFLNTPSK